MIRAVIKVGGSLSRGECLPALGKHLSEVGKRHRLLVVPGGGPFAEVVRVQDRKFGLRDSAAHWMAILGMEQYGWLLADLVPESEPVCSLAAARIVSQAGRVPILLPWALLHATDPLPHTWDVTSDSIAAWVAAGVRAPLLILLKDVDGLLNERPSGASRPRLHRRIAVEQLGRFGVVDGHLPGIVAEYGLDLWLINGERPERLEELLSTGTTTGTRALGKGDVPRGDSPVPGTAAEPKGSDPAGLAGVQ